MFTIVCWVGLLGAFADQAQERPPAGRDWALVRSVSDGQDGTLDFVVVPEQHQRERPYYAAIAAAVCGVRRACLVHFWTDRNDVPTERWMSGRALTRMTATFERSPTYEAPVLRLACWLYTNQAEAEGAKCFYLPGAEVPWPR